MPTFDGSLQIAGDPQTKMPAGIRVDGGRLVILAGPADEIGSWSLSRIAIYRRSGSFVFSAEGEQLMITVDDPDEFVRLVDINEEAPTPGPKQKRKKRSRAEKKERPPKEPRASRSKKEQTATEPAAEPIQAPPAVEPTPTPGYSIYPEPVAAAPPPPPVEERRPAKPKKKRLPKTTQPGSQKLSVLAALPATWKIGGGVALAAILLGIVAPGILTAILMLSGMVTLLLAVVVGSDSLIAARFPDWMNPNNTLAAGVVLLVLSALMMVIT